MDLLYRSTRDETKESFRASKAILQGLAEDGGLFVPEQIPRLATDFKDLAGRSYQEVAYEVMRLFLTDFSEEELKVCIGKAYDEKFDTAEIAPIRKTGGGYYLELFHGATIAFKDMALSILPHFMLTAAGKVQEQKDIVILTATSGDTGKAALAGFANVPGTKIIVFYPKDGVSPIQKRQMVTQKGNNTLVVGIDGNFDEAQTGVKEIFSDEKLKQWLTEREYQFSSANSINIGRLIPQVVYYVYAYGKLCADGELKQGEPLNVVVPTGNFGNILAAFYAKQMGVPLGKLICASNENKVLYDFFATGNYDKNRDFVLTSSPSMDILISSNLERLLFLLTGENPKQTAQLMQDLKTKGRYELTPEMKAGLADFYGNYATEEETAETILRIYKEEGYVLDPHTAVAACVYEKYKAETGDKTKALIVSTASPYKFTNSVIAAIAPEKIKDKDDFVLAKDLEKLSGVNVPEAVLSIKSAALVHTKVCGVKDMKDAVKNWLLKK
ncbi:threonine synthase [Clostridia bacterium]|nr:threonine synthase [Clostridia bacterium]